MEQNNEIYSQTVVEFVTVAAAFCKQLESCHTIERDEFIDTFCKLLPLLYLKTAVLSTSSALNLNDENPDGFIEHPVTEDDYNYVRSHIAALMADADDYLDVFPVDFKYSDQPIRQSISENLADTYQNLRNFVEVYRHGYDEASRQALAEALSSFELEWGQKILGALRALHDAKYTTDTSTL